MEIKKEENIKKKIKRPELLAPGGSYLKAKVAMDYGADAVYIGTPNLSLRSRAKLDYEDMENTIKYAKKKNKKVYAAINIFAYDNQYEEIKKQAAFLEEKGVDGIIAADPGVIMEIRKYAPNIPVNISTQANTISYHTANFWHTFGAKRIITGREMSKDELKVLMENKPKDLEVEIFIHGAICFAYSGRCFLSDFLANRSANCGDCAQSCRWKYNLALEEKNSGEIMYIDEEERGINILSSKDMCLIKELPEIVDLGVDSLKIEGRLKTEYYLATVVHAYKNALDEVISLFEKGLTLEEVKEKYNYKKYLNELLKTKTRQLTTFYFNDKNNKDTQDLEGIQYNLNYEFGGIIENYDFKNNKVFVKIKNKLIIDDEIEVLVPDEDNINLKIKKLYDEDTEDEITEVNPGTKDKAVYITFDKDLNSLKNSISNLEKAYIFRRKIK